MTEETPPVAKTDEPVEVVKVTPSPDYTDLVARIEKLEALAPQVEVIAGDVGKLISMVEPLVEAAEKAKSVESAGSELMDAIEHGDIKGLIGAVGSVAKDVADVREKLTLQGIRL
jgi:hypothetical protein